MLGVLRTAFSDPVFAAYALRARLGRGGLLRRYAELARGDGIDRLYFVLSFDCDTMDDVAVVWGVHSRLLDMGVKPVYAVPGELLIKGEKTYRRILESGGEFINHGYTEHTYFDVDRGEHASCFFYDRLPADVVSEDIRNGDRCLREFLGHPVQGFRAPHFGTFQKPSQLKFMHAVLAELGYLFSTSTVPLYGLRYGPLVRKFGLCEIPVSGMADRPLTILDTWGCFEAPDRVLAPEDYFRQGVAAAGSMAVGGAGLLNYYADPSHIHDQEIFFKTVEHWLSVAKPVNYREFIGCVPCNGKS